MRFALVHSPLVGPSTWRPVANALVMLGHEVASPDLRAAAHSGDPHEFVRAGRAVVQADTDVVVGHSGAGLFLPSIAATHTKSSRLVFVDAGIPPSVGPASPSAEFLDWLRTLSRNGMLPLWSTWWGEGVMERLVPDHEARAEIEAELVEVPLAFYEGVITVPTDWGNAQARFVLLSEAYRSDAATAVSLGWPTVECLGSHLDLVNHPDAIARSILQVLDAGG